ncbi:MULTISPECIES: hypothetical protein [Pseudomonas]|uniref:hypothetical protein n=1 Tax=Pseudomonas TaxID=286 RepID=UPI0012388C61|nr:MULTISPECIES: hypothetical protein [Pseudomonas]QIB52727.1 hypothetical protein G3M63_17745 [Pseudomonas sp. OIL-1]
MSEPVAQHDNEDDPGPLARGAASLPPVIGEGCLARFDPESLNEESGTDFSAAVSLRCEPIEPLDPV